MENKANKKALVFPHFPDQLSTVIFRNWNMLPLEKMAKVFSAPPEKLREIASLLGLPPYNEKNCSLWLERGYITLLRQNWHLLPMEQLGALLEKDPATLEFILKEEDFLYHKLGDFKPEVGALIYQEPDGKKREEYKKVGRIIKEFFPEEDPLQFDPFQFPDCASISLPSQEGLRISYLYDLPYGDPLADDSLGSFPEEKLQAYARAGINGLWFQALLYKLFPPTGATAESERSLTNLKKLCARAAKNNVKFYLYFNEPRMANNRMLGDLPGQRFDKEISSDYNWLCSSVPEVRNYLYNSFRELFNRVPELGGVITITRSENKTHCCSHYDGRHESCPLCSKRSVAEVVAELLNTIFAGMRAGSPDAQLLAWTWSWDEAKETIEKLADGITVLQTSERGVVTDCFGVKGTINDYSVGHPGPSDIAKENWKTALESGLHNCAAKIQINNSWECSAVPYIPVFGLVEQHITQLRQAGVKDFMISWTLGGAPSPMAALLLLPKEEVIAELYGKEASCLILEADRCFCKGLHTFPRNSTGLIYAGPTNYGAMNLLWEESTQYLPTMIGFPYDALVPWRGIYPEDIFIRAFYEMQKFWGDGVALLEKVEKTLLTPPCRKNFEELERFAKAVHAHFRSSYNQIIFIANRDKGSFHKEAVEDEILQALSLFHLQKLDPRIGFEASNHYFYTPNAFMEKVLSCRKILEKREE